MQRSELAVLLAMSAAASVTQTTTAFALTIDASSTVIINDTSDTLSLTISPNAGNNVDASVGCTGEICSFAFTPPSGYGFDTTLSSFFPINILEPNSSVISDILSVQEPSEGQPWVVTFKSGGGFGTYTQGVTLGPSLTETGGIQAGFVLDWPSLTADDHFYEDVVEFQSGEDTTTGVPEPITLSLFGAGLAGGIAMRRRKTNKA